MNEFYKEAKVLLEEAAAKIPGIKDGQDPLDCYSAAFLDESISLLIRARSLMAIGWREDELDGKHP